MSENNPTSSDNINNHANYKVKDNPKKTKRITMGHLPSEILKFVRSESYSLLVKGKPGTGKTTFALTLLDNLKDDNNYFYISTRLSLKQLAFYYPWIEKFFSKDESISGYKFEDARLDEPESLFERITNQLMDVKSPVIIIDTWDTIASFMDRESRLNNERVLQIWRERAGAKLIFLSESIDLTILDSIVDGVISLENRIINSNYHRQLTIDKLRGVPIKCCSYSYSLYQGVFYTFDLIKDLDLLLTLQKTKQKDKRIKKDVIQLYKRSKLAENDESDLPGRFFFGNKFITIVVDKHIDSKLLISLLLKQLYLWVSEANNNKIMINNFESDFSKMCKTMLSYYLYDDKDKILENKFLSQEIDFSDLLETQRETTDNGETDKHLFENKNDRFQDHKYINSDHEKYFETANLNNFDEDLNILNILNGSSILSIINDTKFLSLLEKSFSTNLIVLKDAPSTLYNILLEKGKFYEFNLEGKSVLIRTINPFMSLYGTVLDKKSLFVDWRPIL